MSSGTGSRDESGSCPTRSFPASARHWRQWHETSRDRTWPCAALRLLILTGARRNEVLRLRWENLDREHGIAWLEDTKTGRRALRLSVPAWEVLDGLRGDVPRIKGWCFPSYRVANAPITDVRRTFSAVCSVAGLDGLRLHDLRHSHASVAAGQGLSLPLIGKLLGHKRATTTERYAHLADDPVRDAADRVQGRLADQLAKPPAEVTPLKRRSRRPGERADS